MIRGCRCGWRGRRGGGSVCGMFGAFFGLWFGCSGLGWCVCSGLQFGFDFLNDGWHRVGGGGGKLDL